MRTKLIIGVAKTSGVIAAALVPTSIFALISTNKYLLQYQPLIAIFGMLFAIVFVALGFVLPCFVNMEEDKSIINDYGGD